MREPVDEQAELDRTRAQTFSEQSEPYETQGGVADAMAAVPTFGPPVEPGEVGALGPYRIIKQLGKGGMGAVYAALDTRLDRKIALKVMLPSYAAIPSAKDRFLREARAAAKVSHDNVVTVHEADDRNGVPYIAMQYLEGYPLDEYLKKKGEMAMPQILRIARETAAGLEAAHKLGLIHRDIKPGNLWLEAPNGRVKLLDFGLARPVDSDVELTKSGVVVGTPAYMSPEQAQGERVDARSDLFSLGVLLYRLSTGQLPFPGNTTMAVLMALGTKDPVPVRSLKPELPEVFARLVHDLLAKDPARRPESATEVIRRLRDLNRNPNSLPVASMPQVSMIDAAAPNYVPIPIGMASMANPFEDIDLTDSVTAEPVPRTQSKDVKPTNRKPVLIGGSLAGLILLVVGIAVLTRNQDKPVTKVDVPDVFPVKDKGGKTLAKVGPGKKEPPRLEGRTGLEFQAGDSVTATKVPYRNELTVTIEAWVAPQQSSNDHPRTIAGVPNGYLGVFLDKIRFYTHHGYAECEKAIAPGQRIHVAGVNDGKQRRLYIDGKLAAKTDDPGSAWAEGSDPGFQGELRIGSMDFTGTIEQVRVSTTGRYDKEFAPPETFAKDKDTFALYLFDEGQGDTLRDSSGNGYHAKIAGAKWVSADPDRRAAEWVLAKGGSVQVNVVDALLRSAAELPKEKFALESVNLDGAPIADAELDQLRSLVSLGWLHLGNTAITDAGIAKLESLTNLHSLNLGRLKISDAGLAALKPFAKLKVLVLIDTPVTDDGLAHLKGLRNLTQLSVKGTKFTQKALQEFHAAVPGCKIEHDGGMIEAVDVDRNAAEWVIGQGGFLHLKNSKDEFRAIDQLPKERFEIQKINLSQLAKLEPAGLVHLGPLENLESLELNYTPITDADLIPLGGLVNLRSLGISNTKISATGFAKLANLKKLEILGLMGYAMTDEWMKTVTGFSELHTIYLGGTHFSIDAMRHLLKLKKLTKLNLHSNPHVDDASMVVLKELTTLQDLVLSTTSVTDVGLVHLKELKNLTKLNLKESKVSAQGVAELHAALPRCRIEHDGGVIEPKK
jgi:serine/threonine protein kinase/Leucine-rich repeat (LRR) protein